MRNPNIAETRTACPRCQAQAGETCKGSRVHASRVAADRLAHNIGGARPGAGRPATGQMCHVAFRAPVELRNAAIEAAQGNLGAWLRDAVERKLGRVG